MAHKHAKIMQKTRITFIFSGSDLTSKRRTTNGREEHNRCCSKPCPFQRPVFQPGVAQPRHALECMGERLEMVLNTQQPPMSISIVARLSTIHHLFKKGSS